MEWLTLSVSCYIVIISLKRKRRTVGFHRKEDSVSGGSFYSGRMIEDRISVLRIHWFAMFCYVFLCELLGLLGQ